MGIISGCLSEVSFFLAEGKGFSVQISVVWGSWSFSRISGSGVFTVFG